MRKNVVWCPDPKCRRAFASFDDLFRHAKQTNCDIAALKRLLDDVAKRRLLTLLNREPSSYD